MVRPQAGADPRRVTPVGAAIPAIAQERTHRHASGVCPLPRTSCLVRRWYGPVAVPFTLVIASRHSPPGVPCRRPALTDCGQLTRVVAHHQRCYILVRPTAL